MSIPIFASLIGILLRRQVMSFTRPLGERIAIDLLRKTHFSSGPPRANISRQRAWRAALPNA
jgi:hypothetical protein